MSRKPTGPYDRPIAYDADGVADLYDHDTREGQQRIAKRAAEAEAENAAVAAWVTKSATRSQSDVSRVKMEELAEVIGKKFREERDSVRSDFQAARVEFVNVVAEMVNSELKKSRQQLGVDFRELSLSIREEVAVLKRERAALVEQEKATEEAARKLRVVNGRGT
jgi:hypothetical protein